MPNTSAPPPACGSGFALPQVALWDQAEMRIGQSVDDPELDADPARNESGAALKRIAPKKGAGRVDEILRRQVYAKIAYRRNLRRLEIGRLKQGGEIEPERDARSRLFSTEAWNDEHRRTDSIRRRPGGASERAASHSAQLSGTGIVSDMGSDQSAN
jgi:hypothetical protein